jgi:thiosulfate/3-mercaptopyruvate sulfurtransferase
VILAAFIAAATLAVDTPLVDVAWLAAHTSSRNVVIFHIGPRADYDSAHIAGAQFLNLRDVAAPGGPLALELPEPARLDSVLEALGVADDSRIILYHSSQWISPTTRVYLTLTWAGLEDRVSILDGGIEAWRAAGRPVTRETSAPVPATGRLTIRPRNDVVVDAPFVRGQLGRSDWTIVDARDRVFWTGERPGSGSRWGHIPGALSLPFTTVADSSGRFLSPDQLRRLFAAAGATAGRPVVSYCHIGQQGTAVWFAARLAGYEARLYDGSWQDWSGHDDYPTVTATAAERHP